MMEKVQLNAKPEDVLPLYKSSKIDKKSSISYTYNPTATLQINKKANKTRIKQEMTIFHKTCTKRIGITFELHSSCDMGLK